jgi:ParB family chromosome partitioning protein
VVLLWQVAKRVGVERDEVVHTVPVYVRSSSVSDEPAQLAERVAEQIVENDQRRQLTDAQRARGIQQMIDAGMSVTKVAKFSGPPKTVDVGQPAAP